MHPAHFRRLCRRGVFPKPRNTAKGRPYFDYELLVQIAAALKSGVGHNGEECTFYGQRAKRSLHRSQCRRPDRFIADLRETLAQFGVPQEQLAEPAIRAHLRAAFGRNRPDLATAIAVLARDMIV